MIEVLKCYTHFKKHQRTECQVKQKKAMHFKNTEVICWDSLIQLYVERIPLKLTVNFSEKNYQYEVRYCINPPRSIQECDTPTKAMHFKNNEVIVVSSYWYMY